MIEKKLKIKENNKIRLYPLLHHKKNIKLLNNKLKHLNKLFKKVELNQMLFYKH
jgi:hypothetical protein